MSLSPPTPHPRKRVLLSEDSPLPESTLGSGLTAPVSPERVVSG